MSIINISLRKSRHHRGGHGECGMWFSTLQNLISGHLSRDYFVKLLFPRINFQAQVWAILKSDFPQQCWQSENYKNISWCSCVRGLLEDMTLVWKGYEAESRSPRVGLVTAFSSLISSCRISCWNRLNWTWEWNDTKWADLNWMWTRQRARGEELRI